MWEQLGHGADVLLMLNMTQSSSFPHFSSVIYHSDFIVDDSDTEWLLFRASFLTILKTYIIHAICFRLAQKIPSRTQESLFLVIVWTAMMVQIHSWSCFFICTALALVITGLVAYFRLELIAWVGCILFVLNSGPQYLPYSMQPDVYYREYQMYVYTAVKILNFNIYLCRNKEVAINPYLVLLYIEYLLYPPFCSTLIVLFDDFKNQRHNQKPFQPKEMVILALRLGLWFGVVELALHFLRFNAFFNAPFTTMTGLHNYQVVSIAYLAGQYFHTKYVVIFGIARLFAHIDGITPPESAICISRVTKYSRMWRYFDRGLYQFLKHQLYIPFLGTGDTITLIVRRFVAMVVVFGFVLCWHGLNANYGYWVLLSAVELVIERVGLAFYNSNLGRRLRFAVGEAHFARLSAVCCITNVIPGIFGAFFFLDHKDNGLNIFKNVLVKGFNKLIRLDVHPYNEGFVLLHLLLLGYCFAHVCAFLHVKLDSKPKHSKNE
uniref:Protein-cysteine N-palmitoyltransferase HHAT n=1 Tax=Bursaphelenchus xylophilus TaxID=6326 RepID=A0A1I7RMC7_BURXY